MHKSKKINLNSPKVNGSDGYAKKNKKYKLNSPNNKKYKRKKVSYYKNRKPRRLGLLRR